MKPTDKKTPNCYWRSNSESKAANQSREGRLNNNSKLEWGLQHIKDVIEILERSELAPCSH